MDSLLEDIRYKLRSPLGEQTLTRRSRSNPLRYRVYAKN